MSACPAVDLTKIKRAFAGRSMSALDVMVVDSGCSNHLLGNPTLLTNLRRIPRTYFKGLGNVAVEWVGDSAYGEAYYAEGFEYNLVSWSQIGREREILNAKRSFDEDAETFSISIHGNPSLVFPLDPDLDLYTLSVTDDHFVRQMQTKLAFGGKRSKKIQVEVPNNAEVNTPVPTTIVADVPVIETEEIDTTADTRLAQTEEVVGAPLTHPGLGIPVAGSSAQPLTVHAQKRAAEARRLHSAVGHPSSYAFRLMLANVLSNTTCTPADVTTAEKLFGECVHCAKGKQTIVKTGGTYALATEIGQVLHADLVYGRNGRDVITKRPTMATWLHAVDELTGYVLLIEVISKNTDNLLDALTRMASYFQRYGHVVRKVMVDAESALKSCTTSMGMKGIDLLPRPPGEHEKYAESHTRVLRERMRAIESHMGFVLPNVLVSYLAIAACFSYNLAPNNRSALGSPHTYVTGEKVDAQTYGKFLFGEAVLIPPKEAHTTTNRDEPRATEGMFLGHLFGMPGSGYFLTFPASSKASVQIRSVASARAMTPTTAYMENINGLWPAGTVVPMSVEDELHRVITADDFKKMVAESRAASSKSHKGVGSAGGVKQSMRFAEVLVDPTPEPVPEIAPMLDVPLPDAVMPITVEQTPSPPSTVEQEQTEPPHRRSARANKGVPYKPVNLAVRDEDTELYLFDVSRHALVASIGDELAQFGKPGEVALTKEVQQLLDLDVIEGTNIANEFRTWTSEQRHEILNCRAFLEEKRDGRIKARIVGGTGSSRQVRGNYNDVDSHTVRSETVMLMLKIAAQRLSRLAVLDVPGAFLHAAMRDMRKGHDPSTPRYVKMTGLLVDILVKLKPEWRKYVNDKGVLILELKKALYGLIEASRLWNEELTKTLIAAGFTQSVMDPCLYIHKEKNLLLCVYVDDLLLSYQLPEDLQWLSDVLESKYGAPRVQSGDTVDYLNIRIRRLTESFGSFPAGSYVVDQSDYARDMIAKYNIVGTSSMPHDEDFFDVDEESEKLDSEQTSRYVSICMSLLFTCNRVRVDVFLHTSFLCTRLKEPTEQDMTKLTRVMQYIAGTIDFGMVYSSGDDHLNVFAWIDASYAVHADAKGHSGTIVSVGNASTTGGNIIYVKSRKQKLVARSSTEAELIALHDGLPQVVWTRNLLEELGYKQPEAEVFQDNKSTIFMAETGRGNHNRSKHIAVRFFYAKGLIDEKVVKVTHLSTHEMVADAFTKALPKRQFLKMRDALLSDLSSLPA
jgi:hypothetical protein